MAHVSTSTLKAVWEDVFEPGLCSCLMYFSTRMNIMKKNLGGDCAGAKDVSKYILSEQSGHASKTSTLLYTEKKNT